MSAPLRILRLPDVIGKTGLQRDSIYRLGHEGSFPKPVKISDRATGWIESEVDAFIAERMVERDAAIAAAAPPAGEALAPVDGRRKLTMNPPALPTEAAERGPGAA
jgi:prophage regulatory protein